MAEIRPFRGLYYDADVVGDVGRVIAPPYDVINGSQQCQLLTSHPRNIVRLILPEVPSSEYPWQERAASTFRNWKEDGVFRVSPREAIYLYRQSFPGPDGRLCDRIALIALYRLKEPGGGEIYPHERTFPQVTRDQLELLRRCRANFSQVFSLFRDEEEYRDILRERALPAGHKLLEFRFPADTLNQLFSLEDPGLQEELASLVGRGGIFIADGHHRYETALIFRNECRKTGVAISDALPCDFISMAFVGINDPGLVLLPVHRLIGGTGRSSEELLSDLASGGHLEEVVRRGWEEAVRATADLVISNQEDPLFGVVVSDRAYLYHPAGVKELEAEAAEGAAKAPLLDVTILHRLVIERVLGLREGCEEDVGSFYIRYTVDLEEIMQALSSGDTDIAFLQKSPRVEQAWQLAALGLKMPHKSTYFYPKMPSGLVIYDHGIPPIGI
jgi:uncharacterized protein (DUF1015 family)